MNAISGICGSALVIRVFALVACALLLTARGRCAEVPRPQGPSALVASRDGETLYAALGDAYQVAVVDLADNTVAAAIELRARPTGLVLHPDDQTLYVTCAAPRSMVVAIDTGTRRRIWDVEVGHTAVAPVVTPDGRRLFVCNRFNNDVSV